MDNQGEIAPDLGYADFETPASRAQGQFQAEDAIRLDGKIRRRTHEPDGVCRS